LLYLCHRLKGGERKKKGDVDLLSVNPIPTPLQRGGREGNLGQIDYFPSKSVQKGGRGGGPLGGCSSERAKKKRGRGGSGLPCSGDEGKRTDDFSDTLEEERRKEPRLVETD